MTNTISRDIKLFYDPIAKGDYADIEIDGGDFVLDEGFETMILISLFSDAYVDKRNSYNGESRGFFAEKIIGFNLGSKLWQLDRAKNTKNTLVLAAQYAKEALQWMVDIGIYKKVETVAIKSKVIKNRFDLYMAAYRPDDSIERYKYGVQWEAQIGV